jgi:hypothetical protein
VHDRPKHIVHLGPEMETTQMASTWRKTNKIWSIRAVEPR